MVHRHNDVDDAGKDRRFDIGALVNVRCNMTLQLPARLEALVMRDRVADRHRHCHKGPARVAAAVARLHAAVFGHLVADSTRHPQHQ